MTPRGASESSDTDVERDWPGADMGHCARHRSPANGAKRAPQVRIDHGSCLSEKGANVRFRGVTEIEARVKQTRRLMAKEGPSGLLKRVRRRVARRLMPEDAAEISVTEEDFASAATLAATGWDLPGPLPWADGEPLKVSWVCSPPAPGSGGHTTMFRLVQALIDAGHSCTVYLLDPHEGELSRHIARMRQGWPDLSVPVRDFRAGVEDCHAIFATGWESAWAVLGVSAKGLRCYLVQDFEPSFYAAGSEYLLAEATYRFGFKGITAGAWVAQMLAERYEMEAIPFDFGCDLDRYSLNIDAPDRKAICYYCRPSTPRRAHGVALEALRLFSASNPGTPIHFYGELVKDPGFPVTQHGVMSPTQLNELYNSCIAGLVLSATNVSLVPHEMLASGCIPVVNDAEHNRLVLANEMVAYSGATPYELAATLKRLVDEPAAEHRAAAAAASASVSSRTWASVGTHVVESIIHLVRQATAD